MRQIFKIIKNEFSFIKDYFIFRINLSIMACIDKIESIHKLEHNKVFNYQQLYRLLLNLNYEYDTIKKYMYVYIGYMKKNGLSV